MAQKSPGYAHYQVNGNQIRSDGGRLNNTRRIGLETHS
jgi:hypothetical protein